MRILFAASEAAPFAKAGGLADVIGSLPKAIQKRKVQTAIVMPRHKCTRRFEAREIYHCEIETGWRKQYAGLLECEYDGVKVYFIDNEYYFGGDSIYGYDEGEAEKYAFFSKAVVELLPFMGEIDIIHCNDWQTGLIPCFLKNFYPEKNIRTVFTVHNLKYRGIFGFRLLHDLFGFPDSLFTSETLEFYGGCSYLKAGLLYADKITTVSPSYRDETLTPEFGEGMEGVLQIRCKDYSGILNGLGDEFNPETDKNIPFNFSCSDFRNKARCKRELQKELGLNIDPSVPLFAVVARLYDQKGVDLIKGAINEIMFSRNVQLVVLGSGDRNYEDFFLSLNDTYRGRVKTQIGYNEPLARRIYAASDFFLMPSRFEPCGLSQLIAMRYGSLPIVRACGGLKDTVKDVSQGGWGLVFDEYSADKLKNEIFRACDIYNKKSVFYAARKRGAAQDTRWDKGAGQYISIYTEILGGCNGRKRDS